MPLLKKIRNIIQKICRKFLGFFEKKDQETEQKTRDDEFAKSSVSDDYNKEYWCGLTFNLRKDYDIDIAGMLPIIEELDSDQISDIAEKYAQLLLSVNSGLFSKKIIEIIENKSKVTTDYNEQLFIQNVLVYYGLLKEELNAYYKNTNVPVIKPSFVFKSK